MLARLKSAVLFSAPASSALFLPPPSTGIDYIPIASPKYKGDALLSTSDQDLHTQLAFSRVGIVNIKLESF